MKNNNKHGFAIIFAMGIVLTISLTVVFLLEYIVPFAKDTKGIEFSTNAFYQANSAIETALMHVADNNLNYKTYDNSPDPLVSIGYGTDYGYNIVSIGDIIPPTGEGNSEYDKDYNIIAIGLPVQLEIGGDEWNNAIIDFNIPNIGSTSSLKTQTGGIVAWQLSSSSDTLNSKAKNDRIIYSDINGSSTFNITNKDGELLDGSDETFGVFYNNNCSNTNDKCTLKLSIINPIELVNGTPIPYLEYKINGADDLPLRYTRINSSGYSKGFKKDLKIKIPQQTVNEAFDFTVFQ